MQLTVLIIDDEVKLAGLISRIIELEGYHTLRAHTARDGLEMLSKHLVHLVLSDVKLPDASGVELVKKIKDKYPYIEVICLTAYGTIQDGVTAIKNGAFDYITKGDDNDRILPLLAKASEKAAVQYKLFQLESRLIGDHGFDRIVGNSPALQQAVNLARKVAATDTTVLLLGETGTGKEVFAQAIHYNSPRKQRSFVAVNCSAFAKDLLESELFGYKAGAFTGATKDKRGLLEEADGGTLFLDEIGEMNIDLQAKLLRVLETGELMKVGDTKTQKLNVRIIAATNRDLEEEIEKGNFRRDLFYRLSVFNLQLPSLNDRPEDIPLLALQFVTHFAQKTNKKVIGISDQMMDRLKSHRWKGNIRELKNVIERSVILTDGEVLSAEDLPFNDHTTQSGIPHEMAEVEKRHILWMLNHTKGNKTEAARLMKIGLTTLYRKMEEYGISQ
ncbi:sigma-54-dependent transcriptional regulator [Mucilaginibacter myungsuensis]|uniref:Sigma-54-dependent Fis family transcriptional regulator n=1 Tax=Mucilaginibacter myungsuensis TaxID=649104 RepID=A0A929KTF8_9SPHI|nr:sigma-54 dependent transcriptional regulator [Mucilaginibacter myungsuensis]MBE9661239.1 sigma-54-dependent Fis family transcriptional regulator [Mucilaginibacter myungsuensis]MDN3597382.1 sigma-54 dependent transcriptional regulator [Mucilaginibacter myungsuensis]